MKKRDLKDILREVHKESVKEPETIKQYMRALGDRTLYSLMYGNKKCCSDEERYDCWSCLEFVLMAYAGFRDLTDEEIARCLKNITFKDFLCLIDHLNDHYMEPEDFEEKGIIRNDFGMAYMQETALGYLLKLLLRAKGWGDPDVNNFCRINTDTVLCVTNEDRKESKRLVDFFYIVKDRLNLDSESWMLGIGKKKSEFYCMRTLLLDCMMEFGYGKRFSLTETIERCTVMCDIGV